MLQFLPLLLLISSSIAEDKRVVCYLGSWAAYRYGTANFQPENIDVSLCTHVIYSFAGLHYDSNEIISLDPNLDLGDNGGKNSYKRTLQLKEANPNLKVLLAIGGWNEGSYKYSQMVTDAAKRSTFINSVIATLGAFGFDGLDIDWEYPANRGGAISDKEYLVTLLKELRQEFDKHGWLLTIAVGMGPTHIIGYDVAHIAAFVDFVNMMTYDLRDAWGGVTGHHTQLFRGPNDAGTDIYLNLNASVHTWLSRGVPAEKLTLGIAFYGKTFTVPESSNGPIGVPCTGTGAAFPHTQQNGFVGYNEFCLELQTGQWSVETNDYVKAPWAYKGDQWVAYDDPESITVKSNWAKSLGIGGALVWSIETDDFLGSCGDGTFPLLRALNNAWRGEDPSATSAPSKPTTLSTTTTTLTSSNPTSKPVTTTTKKPEPITETSTTTTSVSSTSCTPGQYKRDPNDCSKYFQCSLSGDGTGVWVSLSCPQGLYFNEAVLACDFPQNVNC